MGNFSVAGMILIGNYNRNCLFQLWLCKTAPCWQWKHQRSRDAGVSHVSEWKVGHQVCSTMVPKTAWSYLFKVLCICLSFPCSLQCTWRSLKNKLNQAKKIKPQNTPTKPKKKKNNLQTPEFFTCMIICISFISTVSFLSKTQSLLTSHPHRVKSGATVGVLQFHGYCQTREFLCFIITANSKYGSEPKNWLAPWAFHVSSCHEWHERGRRINSPPPHTEHTASLGHWALDAQAQHCHNRYTSFPKPTCHCASVLLMRGSSFTFLSCWPCPSFSESVLNVWNKLP